MGLLLFICVHRSAIKETGHNENITEEIAFEPARLFYLPFYVVFSCSVFLCWLCCIFVWLAEWCDQHNWKWRLSWQVARTNPGNGQQIWNGRLQHNQRSAAYWSLAFQEVNGSSSPYQSDSVLVRIIKIKHFTFNILVDFPAVYHRPEFRCRPASAFGYCFSLDK